MIAYVKEYSSFASDIDLTVEPPAEANAGSPSRIEVLDAGGGGLALEILNSGVQVTLTDLPTGDVQLNPGKILATGTSVGKIRVWWTRRG